MSHHAMDECAEGEEEEEDDETAMMGDEVAGEYGEGSEGVVWDPVHTAIGALDEFYDSFGSRHEDLRAEANKVTETSGVDDDAFSQRHVAVAQKLRGVLRDMIRKLQSVDAAFCKEMVDFYGDVEGFGAEIGHGHERCDDESVQSVNIPEHSDGDKTQVSNGDSNGGTTPAARLAGMGWIDIKKTTPQHSDGCVDRDGSDTSEFRMGWNGDGSTGFQSAGIIDSSAQSEVENALEMPPLLDCRSLPPFTSLTREFPPSADSSSMDSFQMRDLASYPSSPSRTSTYTGPHSVGSFLDGYLGTPVSSSGSQIFNAQSPSSNWTSPALVPSDMSQIHSSHSVSSFPVSAGDLMPSAFGQQQTVDDSLSFIDFLPISGTSSEMPTVPKDVSQTADQSHPVSRSFDLDDLVRQTIGSPSHNSEGPSALKEEESHVDEGKAEKKLGRKNIRKLIDDDNLDEATVNAAMEEEERLARVKAHEESLHQLVKEDEDLRVVDVGANVEIKIDAGLAGWLKPHQFDGVKFMYRAVVENMNVVLERPGAGCILAHCMGLGKSLQVVAFVHTILSAEQHLKLKRVLVLCPYNVILNWCNEFRTWLARAEVFGNELLPKVCCVVKEKTPSGRLTVVEKWFTDGGVLIMGYDMFRLLATADLAAAKLQQQQLPVPTAVRSQKKCFSDEQCRSLLECLLHPGPDVVICDEGHLLKNEETKLFKCLNSVRTARRIVLTGTPLQNNLKEYHCMVQFVKPKLLGTLKEFTNRFVNPIMNGQWGDSTPEDVKVMKQRAHVLFNLLNGCVHRRDYSVLNPYLPSKMEFVVSVRLSEVQIRLYELYLDNVRKRGALPDDTESDSGNKLCVKSRLFADFVALSQICCHPVALKLAKEKYKNKATVTLEKDDDELASSLSQLEKEAKMEIRDWWQGHLPDAEVANWSNGGKLVLLKALISGCQKLGDKILVFSQSLLTLDVVEACFHADGWTAGIDYYRIDGSTSVQLRSKYVDEFNAESNVTAKVVLISTKAGSLGINLVAANRVVILDACWNPTHDVQAIFRAYRFGQRKPVFVYRFLAQGTLEQKIYERQVTKLSLSCRVVDELQVDRHYASSKLAELYKFDPDRPRPEGQEEVLRFPQADFVLAELLSSFRRWVSTYHEHDSLLANREDEGLSEEERRNAWAEYEREKRNPVKWVNTSNGPVRTPGFVPQSGFGVSGPGLWQSALGGENVSMQERAYRFFTLQKKCGRYPNGCSGSLAAWDEHFVCPRCRKCHENAPCTVCRSWTRAQWTAFNNRAFWEKEYPANREAARSILAFYHLKTQQRRPPNSAFPLNMPVVGPPRGWPRSRSRGSASGLSNLASRVPEIHRRLPDLADGKLEVTVARRTGFGPMQPPQVPNSAGRMARMPGRTPLLRNFSPGTSGQVGVSLGVNLKPNIVYGSSPTPSGGGMKRSWSAADFPVGMGRDPNAKWKRLIPAGPLNASSHPPLLNSLLPPPNQPAPEMRRIPGMMPLSKPPGLTPLPHSSPGEPYEMRVGNMLLRKASRRPNESGKPPTVL